MYKLPQIKTAKFRKAIDAYYTFKHELWLETGDVAIPRDLREEFDNVCNNVLTAGSLEHKSCAIIAGTIVVVEKMGLGRDRTGWINSASHNRTPEWKMKESM